MGPRQDRFGLQKPFMLRCGIARPRPIRPSFIAAPHPDGDARKSNRNPHLKGHQIFGICENSSQSAAIHGDSPGGRGYSKNRKTNTRSQGRPPVGGGESSQDGHDPDSRYGSLQAWDPWVVSRAECKGMQMSDNGCHWEEIREFGSPSEFARFQQWMEE
jgi:hypothetical protein